jgi:hypothetical protein
MAGAERASVAAKLEKINVRITMLLYREDPRDRWGQVQAFCES